MSNIKNFKTLQHMLKSAKFETKGDAITLMASALLWFDSLEKTMVELDKKEEAKPKVEPIEKPVKNGKANVDK